MTASDKPRLFEKIGDEQQRADWVAIFMQYDQRVARAIPSEFDFPVLHAASSPSTWISHYYRTCATPLERHRIRRAVIDLLDSEGAISPMYNANPLAVVGGLVLVVGYCHLRAAHRKLKDLLVRNIGARDVIRDGEVTVSLRRRLWETYLCLSPNDGDPDVVDLLIRDISLPECAGLCYRAAASIRPRAALELLPTLIRHAEPQWQYIVLRSITRIGVFPFMQAQMQSTWQELLHTIVADFEYLLHGCGCELEHEKQTRPAIIQCFRDAGISLEISGTTVRISAIEHRLPDITFTLPEAPQRSVYSSHDLNRLLQSTPEMREGLVCST